MIAAEGTVETERITPGVREAAAALRALFDPTPLQRYDYLSSKYRADVWLKREDLSPVRSYKLRGAFNAMRKALPDVKERALRWEGRNEYYTLRLPQRPGALREFLTVLGPDDDISRFEHVTKSARNFGSVLLGIETSARASFEAPEARMAAAGFTWIDITDDAAITGLIT